MTPEEKQQIDLYSAAVCREDVARVLTELQTASARGEAKGRLEEHDEVGCSVRNYGVDVKSPYRNHPCGCQCGCRFFCKRRIKLAEELAALADKQGG